MIIIFVVGLPVKTSPIQNVPKPKRSLVSSQSVVSVKAVTMEFYRKIILRSKLILKLGYCKKYFSPHLTGISALPGERI